MNRSNKQWLEESANSYAGKLTPGSYGNLIVKSTDQKVHGIKFKANLVVSKGRYIHSDENPYELLSMRELAQKSTGIVLVVGAGSGALLRMLVENERVSEILVIENDQELVDLLSPEFPLIEFNPTGLRHYNYTIVNSQDFVPLSELYTATHARSPYVAISSKTVSVHEAASSIGR